MVGRLDHVREGLAEPRGLPALDSFSKMLTATTSWSGLGRDSVDEIRDPLSEHFDIEAEHIDRDGEYSGIRVVALGDVVGDVWFAMY